MDDIILTYISSTTFVSPATSPGVEGTGGGGGGGY